MKTRMGLLVVLVVPLQSDFASAGDLALTIYNQNFAVVRDKVGLELRAGTNEVRFVGATAFVEPSSVILRDPSEQHAFQVLEQNYRGDPVSQEIMLALNEGKRIDFEIVDNAGGQTRREMISGRIVRSGSGQGVSSYAQYGAPSMQPIIEMNGKLRFGLPGQPVFPALASWLALAERSIAGVSAGHGRTNGIHWRECDRPYSARRAGSPDNRQSV